MMRRSELARWFPFLNWPRLTGTLLRGELVAGLTVALVMVPQSVAYASLAGMPLVTGLYAAILPGLVAVMWSASTRLSVGPTALTALLVFASLSPLAPPGSPRWVELAVWLALLSGVLQLALGLLRAGWLLNLVSSPVLAGFTQAAALLIIGSQLPALLGLPGPLRLALPAAADFDLTAAAYGFTALAVLIGGRLWLPRLPWVMLVVAGAAGASYQLEFRGAIVGALPVELPRPYWPALLDASTLLALLAPAAVISLVSFLETASSAKVENQRDGKRWDDNQDLVGQGLAKLAAAVSGSFPTSASFSRSAVSLYAGARTGWAAVVTVLMVVLALLLLTPALHYVPRSVLAAVVVAAVAGLLKPAALRQYWRVSRVEAGIVVATFAVTLATAPRIYWGVLAGVLLGMTHFLYQRLHPRIIEVGLHPDGSLRDRRLWHLPPLAAHVFALRMDAALDFASASGFERHVVEHLGRSENVRHIFLFAQPLNRVDATGVEVFGQLRRVLAARGIVFHISGLKLPVETVLRQAGELPESPWLRMYRTDAEALAALAALPAGSDKNEIPEEDPR